MASSNSPVTTGRELVIEHVFDAPRELVWKAWTDPDMYMKWMGPNGYTCPVCKIDLRVGGKTLVAMRGSDGKDIWSTGVYKEIVPFERIVVTDSFADEHGNAVPASHYGMEGEFPLELLVTVTFEDLDGKTRMTLVHSGLPAGEASGGEGAGWNQSFDKLAAALASA